MGYDVRGLDAGFSVLPAILGDAGYTTALIGKRHMEMVGVPDMHFHHQFLVEGKCQFTANNQPDEYRRFLSGKGYGDEWKVWESSRYQEHFWAVSLLPEEDYIDSFIGRQAVSYSESADQQPFFLWLSFCSPHIPWDPPVPFDRLYDPSAIPMPRRRPRELDNKPSRQMEVARMISPPGPGNAPDLGPSGLSKNSPWWGVFHLPGRSIRPGVD